MRVGLDNLDSNSLFTDNLAIFHEQQLDKSDFLGSVRENLKALVRFKNYPTSAIMPSTMAIIDAEATSDIDQ